MYLKYIPLIPKVGSIKCLSWSMVLGYIAKNIMKYTWYQSWKVEIKTISLWEQSDPDTRRDGGHFKSKKKLCKEGNKNQEYHKNWDSQTDCSMTTWTLIIVFSLNVLWKEVGLHLWKNLFFNSKCHDHWLIYFFTMEYY